jgi:hypothetical protein
MHIPVSRIYAENFTISDCSNRCANWCVLVDGAVDFSFAALLIIAGVYFGIVFEG